MSSYTFNVRLDAEAIVDDALQGADLSGLGADGDSEYEITDTSIDVAADGAITVTVEVERISGKFAARSDIEEVIEGALAEHESIDDAESEAPTPKVRRARKPRAPKAQVPLPEPKVGLTEEEVAEATASIEQAQTDGKFDSLTSAACGKNGSTGG